MIKEALASLYEVAGSAGALLILPHSNPDPDAIASAVALRYLLAERLGMGSTIVYQGIIGRSENRALVRYLGCPLELWTGADVDQPSCLALVDTQPGAGNIMLPPGAQVILVIDHHACRKETAMVSFADVRPELGATSTILTQYLQEAGVEPPSPLATALFYGIKTVTMGLSRDTAPADAAAYSYLQPRTDASALAHIEHAQVSIDYFRSFGAALRAARLYGGLIIADIGVLAYPDLVAEMADILLRLERAQWVVCIGVYQESVILSVRTRGHEPTANELVKVMVAGEGSAGGHGTIAGGQIPLAGRSAEQMASLLSRRVLQYMGIPFQGSGETLV